MKKPASRSVLSVLLLQIVMFGALPLAHAEAEAAALTTPLHISGVVDHGCPTHVDELCQLCRWSTRVFEPVTRPSTLINSGEKPATSPSAFVDCLSQPHIFSSLGPRAPPF